MSNFTNENEAKNYAYEVITNADYSDGYTDGLFCKSTEAFNELRNFYYQSKSPIRNAIEQGINSALSDLNSKYFVAALDKLSSVFINSEQRYETNPLFCEAEKISHVQQILIGGERHNELYRLMKIVKEVPYLQTGFSDDDISKVGKLFAKHAWLGQDSWVGKKKNYYWEKAVEITDEVYRWKTPLLKGVILLVEDEVKKAANHTTFVKIRLILLEKKLSEIGIATGQPNLVKEGVEKGLLYVKENNPRSFQILKTMQRPIKQLQSIQRGLTPN